MLAAAVVLAAATSFPASGVSGDSRLIVQGPPELAAAAARVSAMGDHEFAAIVELVGLSSFGPPIQVILAPENSEAARRAPSWVAGYAMGPLGVVVLFPARVPSYPDRNLESLVHHEVAHILASRAAAGRPLPRWFDEGIATVAARQWTIEDRARVTMAVLGRGPRSTRELDAAFISGEGNVARAYALSAHLVRYLIQRHGREMPGFILARVAGGESFERAVLQATGRTLAEIERDFFRRNVFWNTWVPFLTSTTALWLAITLLALAAFRARRRRDARLREVWSMEEELLGLRRETAEDPDLDDPADDPYPTPHDDPSRFN